MRDAVRTVLLVAAVICFVISMTYRVSVEKAPDGGEVRRQTVGLESSPWYEETVEDGPNRYRSEFRFTVWCWSAAVMLVGLVLLRVRMALEQARTQTPTAERGGQP
jgi:hypothetical protein